ncbi:hypothetical protein Sango_1912600 [Sesamum angolense]|uniref:Uncharacterized protein n=1 Tax=Sesamum angolense TaxID=2727404 RepID=A0AAE1WJ32_9LAMI|nr:hypothetical protein Sango_1912600 [Sesamum angolense]
MDVTNLKAVIAGQSYQALSVYYMELQGLGGPLTVQHLGQLDWDHNPSLVYLWETNEVVGGTGLVEIYKNLWESNNNTRELTWNILARRHAQSDRLWLARFMAVEWSTLAFRAQNNEENFGRETWVLSEKQITPKVTTKIDLVRKELERIAAYEETAWRQWIKDLWLLEGDWNTGYFHQWASQRFKTNCIWKIRTPEGQWVVSEEEIQRCIDSHFREVYASSQPLTVNIAKGTEFLHNMVDASMVEDLLQPYMTLEVSKTLFQMMSQNSPGLDVSLSTAQRRRICSGVSDTVPKSQAPSYWQVPYVDMIKLNFDGQPLSMAWSLESGWLQRMIRGNVRLSYPGSWICMCCRKYFKLLPGEGFPGMKDSAGYYSPLVFSPCYSDDFSLFRPLNGRPELAQATARSESDQTSNSAGFFVKALAAAWPATSTKENAQPTKVTKWYQSRYGLISLELSD